MQLSLALTALLMGLAGGPHCVVMCGAVCAGLGGAGGARNNAALLVFQLGRVVGYSLLGAIAAASMQGLGWLTIHSAALRPVWSLLHVAMVLLGLVLVVRGQQPVWLDVAGRRIWQRARSVRTMHLAAPAALGILWSLLPCGLLYSALLVAAISTGPLAGGAIMAAFAVGTSVSMTAIPWLWLRLGNMGKAGTAGSSGKAVNGNTVIFGGAGAGRWGVRLAGAALAVSAGWALWMGIAHNAAPWCVTT